MAKHERMMWRGRDGWVLEVKNGPKEKPDRVVQVKKDEDPTPKKVDK